SAVDIVNSAVLFNLSGSESGAGGAIGAPLTVRDSIFAGNQNSKGILNCTSFPAVRSLGGNVEDTSTCAVAAGDRPSTDPRIDTLGLYGGTTEVYNLVPGSPAIDFATRCEPLDQRGMPRPQGAACDSGPYELVPAPPQSLDRDFSMAVGKRLLVVKRGVQARLTCPSSEVSPPCRGKVFLYGLSTPGGPGLHPLIARKKSARFTISAGKTKSVLIRFSRAVTKALPKRLRLRKGLLWIAAEDAVGNRWEWKKKRPLLVAKRG
ncbi:MAG TPA: choice-of-anchor Q domain-containing protein, partial [Solirubrobacterales bacterium]|nr:choice-of-anchor Q domain-containing protein [Solirubrobacterales bacterium]